MPTYLIVLDGTVLAASTNYNEICDLLIGMSTEAQLCEIPAEKQLQ